MQHEHVGGTSRKGLLPPLPLLEALAAIDIFTPIFRSLAIAKQ
jgi:hypothetical protein